MNFYKIIYQPILRYLYTEAIKRQGEISLHKHFNDAGAYMTKASNSVVILQHYKTQTNNIFRPLSGFYPKAKYITSDVYYWCCALQFLIWLKPILNS